MSWRFICLGSVPPEYGAAADAAVFGEVSEGRSPATLHIYSRDSTAVSLGRFRDLDTDVRPEAFERLGICAVRRISGGSTVLTGPSQIVYSFTSEDFFGSKKDSYAEICGCVASALSSLGLDAVYKEPNDILSGGMKISGGAQYRAGGFLIQHGTVIVEPEPLIEEVLMPLKERSYPGTTSISERLGHSVPGAFVAEALRRAFRERLCPGLSDGILTEEELHFIAENSGRFRV
ncbi:MAG: biotin/lipoate A/B protein ligase family protein [Candidatus Methanomethylophilaceae archaeon]|jgi:lipoate-protein ligase A|nr:biotin/lipoate A/B protein ligase family protein [Candidatus Methanomethylophilaceae archaeon]MDD3351383.1 biotin/lipoate A/B protein ligase family protein [Candidatus Methanomethylophilaceae archaeon]MDD3986755.1 biotin/lipoate A/B protein ligase family protein [Candidatus Methanomethylophilaceae archaeon]MDD4709564.1 biotin/lipoate A/B protein ligase family protein [Candidatus Methanomethylophilaceae archaeon]MDY0251988.1 biotin/lipoate A/B protein ligase family protein [Candidatus Methano